MFQFLFKYPSPVFTKGRFVLLGAWPAWLLPVLIVVAAGGLALLIRSRLARSCARMLRSWRAWTIWGMQSALDCAGPASFSGSRPLSIGGTEFAAEHHRRGC